MTAENETKVVSLLSDLAAKLGQSVETLWPHAVRYEVYSALMSMLGATIAFGVCVWGWRACMKKIDSSQKDRYGFTDDMEYKMALACLFCGFVTCVAVFVAQIPIVIAPTGYVVRQVLR